MKKRITSLHMRPIVQPSAQPDSFWVLFQRHRNCSVSVNYGATRELIRETVDPFAMTFLFERGEDGRFFAWGKRPSGDTWTVSVFDLSFVFDGPDACDLFKDECRYFFNVLDLKLLRPT